MPDFVANAGTILLAVLGISFLIFVHEAGHFLAARLFKVRVEVFSLGFGPRIFGWHRGDTDYRISAFPLGGYVKMAGEYGDFMEEGDRVAEEDDLNSKPIWQRFIIFAAGPAVNFLLAFILFPIGFAAGAPFFAPAVGDVVVGGTAWEAGLEPGDKIVSINGNRVYGFSDVVLEIALSDPDDTTAVVRRDGREFEERFALQRDAGDSRFDLGVTPSQLPILRVQEGGAAAKAGIQEGDTLIGVEDRRVGEVSDGMLVTPSGALTLLVSRPTPATVHVERDGRPLSFVVAPNPRDTDGAKPKLGALPVATRVQGLRHEAAAPGFPLQRDDVIERVGATTVLNESGVRDALRQSIALGNGVATLDILRNGKTRTLSLDEAQVAAVLARDISFTQDLTGPLRIQIVEGGPLEEAGMLDGDHIVALNKTPLPDFVALKKLIDDHPEHVDYTVSFLRDGQPQEVSVRARSLVLHDFGLASTTHEIIYDFGFLDTMVAGVDSSINSIRNTGLTLAKLFTGEVGTENLGGPIAISVITYEAAKWSFAKLLMFLAALSVNLGLINILPIPVLDGGQIVFLMCEKVKGSRLSERFMQNAQLAGFVAILALMVYVTFNDFANFI